MSRQSLAVLYKGDRCFLMQSVAGTCVPATLSDSWHINAEDQPRLFVLKCMNQQHIGHRDCLNAIFQLCLAVSHGLKCCAFSR